VGELRADPRLEELRERVRVARKMAVQFRAGASATSGDFIVLRLALSSEAAPEVQDAVRVSVRVF
jgi:hypothetical protein